MPAKIELDANTPSDLRDEFVAVLHQLGPVQDLSAQFFSLETATFVLAAISAAADLLAIATQLIKWRDKAGSRGVQLDKVKIVAGDQTIDLKNTDTQTLIRVLEGLRDS